MKKQLDLFQASPNEDIEMEESLGILGELDPLTCFTFNGRFTYVVVSNLNGVVKYRRIPKYYKSDPQSGLDFLDREYGEFSEHRYAKIYEGNESKEVYDFLPF